MKMTGFKNELLKKYISFLEQNYKDEVINYFHLLNLESLPFYSRLNFEETTKLINHQIYVFLKSIIEGSLSKYNHSWISDLTINKIPWTSFRDKSTISQLLLNRKTCLLQFITDYTKDVHIAISIIHEIESISSQQDHLLLKFHIQQKKAIKTKVKETNIEENLIKIRKILDHTPIHINLYDLDKDRAIFNNGAGKTLLGLGPEQLKSHSFSKIWLSKIHQEDKEKIKARIKNFKNLKKGEIERSEYRIIDIHGNTTWIYSRASVFKTENGNVKEVLLNGIEINALKQEEEKRKYVEDQLKEAQKIAHVGSYDWDIVNDVTNYTEEAYKIYNLPKDKKTFSLENFKSILDKQSIKRFEENLMKVFEDKNNMHYESQYTLVLPDGNKKDLITRANIIRDKNGNPLRMIGTVMDITSIKKAEHELRKKNIEVSNINKKLNGSQKKIHKLNLELEERVSQRTNELKESEKRYKFIAENIPNLFWTTRPNGDVDFQNKNAQTYTGATFDELKNWNWKPYLHPDDLTRVLKTYKKALRIGEPFEIEYRVKRADGAYRWHLGKYIPLKDNHGNVIKWMGSAIDIHDQKKYAEELKIKNKQLTRTNNDLDNFVYAASHDLKAPITNIEGLLSALNDEINVLPNIDGDIMTMLNMMDTSVKKFKKTILSLTEITEVQNSKAEIMISNNMEDVLDKVKSMVGDLMNTTKATIHSDFKECGTIFFSKKNLISILYNLVSNSIKFRSHIRPPEIFIKTQCIDHYIELSVKDNGQGFDLKQKSKIFKMFQRLNGRVEGSGIGLYLVNRIITNAGGKIEVESEIGKGSIFKIYIPIKTINEN